MYSTMVLAHSYTILGNPSDRYDPTYLQKPDRTPVYMTYTAFPQPLSAPLTIRLHTLSAISYYGLQTVLLSSKKQNP